MQIRCLTLWKRIFVDALLLTYGHNCCKKWSEIGSTGAFLKHYEEPYFYNEAAYNIKLGITFLKKHLIYIYIFFLLQNYAWLRFLANKQSKLKWKEMTEEFDPFGIKLMNELVVCTYTYVYTYIYSVWMLNCLVKRGYYAMLKKTV